MPEFILPQVLKSCPQKVYDENPVHNHHNDDTLRRTRPRNSQLLAKFLPTIRESCRGKKRPICGRRTLITRMKASLSQRQVHGGWKGIYSGGSSLPIPEDSPDGQIYYRAMLVFLIDQLVWVFKTFGAANVAWEPGVSAAWKAIWACRR